MSKAKFTALLGLVESEDEDSDILLSHPLAQTKKTEKMPTIKKGRGAAVSRATKPAQNATRTSTRAAATTMERKALAEKPSNAKPKATAGRGKKRPATEDVDEVDDPDHDGTTVEPEAKAKPARGRPRTAKTAKIEEEAKDPELEAPEAAPQAKRGRKPKARVATPPVEHEIAETQQPELEIPESQPANLLEDSIEDDQVEDLPPYDRAALSSAQCSSSAKHPQHHAVPFSAIRRPMAASDSELNDPSLRRRIGDLTRKYDNLETKYKDLREIGVKEAERNYDRLKQQGEERAETANQLITTLKAQLAAQTELAKDSQRLRKQLEMSEKDMTELQDKITEMTNSLAETKKENKTLSTRLAASRAAEAANVKVPSSAIKGNMGNNRMLANAEAAVQTAQMKEDLYGDLTGLMIRNVKRENDEEVYDCIQTGRNGTLHFKLSIGTDNTSGNIDEVQFMYMPQLDPNRDRALIDVLPDYLVEEITFPRPHAAKFFARVMKCMAERPE
ncbi:chromosome segregation protein Csm1/Pcs1-domain-containing protein [Pseudomassariella vexata]|uniref:Chromosome segregation protein Csm1/Pcs1-domain-containing protein n=1 Tax=Pseudomassariella vexata TaxID=1141098 RepID=A0A1Y2DVD0_9PEZI|nr:chromosome segregation protein Csm1/Pcs1-domain-containing protein [Pseudomassariella vexata]ORY63094.1 chromosome segregation protein Csm1/Pcs1-domain-containing protein [Pseudomassariella vexata]